MDSWGNRHVFTGDTLLINGCGAPISSRRAQAMFHSLTQVLFRLPDVHHCLARPRYQGRTHSSIGQERAAMPAWRARPRPSLWPSWPWLNLPRPKRMDEAVPANLLSGLTSGGAGSARPSAMMWTASCRLCPGPPPAMQVTCRPRWPGPGCRRARRCWWMRTDAEREWALCPVPCPWPGSSGGHGHECGV